jgi:membrane protein DedA with SNARE-associated domain
MARLARIAPVHGTVMGHFAPVGYLSVIGRQRVCRRQTMLSNSIASLLILAGARPLFQAGAIVVGTFILEDGATVAAAMQAAGGRLSIAVALMSLFVGIVLGDLGLYGLGWMGARVRWMARLLPPQRKAMIRGWLAGRVFKVVFACRFLPGLRLPTYTTCGFLGADFRQFTLAAVIATTIWTSLLFGLSLMVGRFLMDHLGAWRWAGAAGFLIVVVLAGRFAAARAQSARQ